MINKEDFTVAYASTMTKPSNREVEYIKQHLTVFTSVLPDRVFEHHGFIECHCIDERADDYGNYVLHCWEVGVPAENELDSASNRMLSILQCGNCGKWALCD
ncbi:hypothetical protein [Bacillus sp. FJAT-27251]|uniref:hypothetical protein n=1 Tax=Bacillus sp. FJAT-27251 TaxID=1684142 RepID=UPI0006A7C44B|nr:hypothetical protein [Bacillus sp. FJAT-27251]